MKTTHFQELPEGSGLPEDASMQINISDLISALTNNSTEKDDDWNATNLTSTTTNDDSVNFNEDNDSVNSIPHSAVPRLLSWWRWRPLTIFLGKWPIVIHTPNLLFQTSKLVTFNLNRFSHMIKSLIEKPLKNIFRTLSPRICGGVKRL